MKYTFIPGKIFHSNDINLLFLLFYQALTDERSSNKSVSPYLPFHQILTPQSSLSRKPLLVLLEQDCMIASLFKTFVSSVCFMSKHSLPRTPWSADSYWKPTFASLPTLVVSLFLFGVGDGLLVISHLGSTPWTVFAQGINNLTGGGLGFVSFCISIGVMATWLPFKQKPGLGTILNIALIALGLGLTAHFAPPPETMLGRVLCMLGGVALIGVSSAFYLTCHMGPGPRDGLMVGLFQATGLKIGTIRTIIEGTVCLLGWLLGGIVGIGTLVFALGVGWVLQLTLDLLIRQYFVHE